MLVGAEVSGCELPTGPAGSLVSPLEGTPSLESGVEPVESIGPGGGEPVAPDDPGDVPGGVGAPAVPPVGPAGAVLPVGGVGEVELAGASVLPGADAVVVGSGALPEFLLAPHAVSPKSDVKTTGAAKHDETRLETVREIMAVTYQKRNDETAGRGAKRVNRGPACKLRTSPIAALDLVFL